MLYTLSLALNLVKGSIRLEAIEEEELDKIYKFSELLQEKLEKSTNT